MIKEIFLHFGESAFNILKKYENKQIRINKRNTKNNSLVKDFIKVYGEHSYVFFKKHVSKRLSIKNVEVSLKRYLKQKMENIFYKITGKLV